ncbi:hypothetical protein [Candidatus Amarolinea dominans]|uniref:hypothetical protein n=1 Tax=Candidatus Amarolinea dominans TaxID=3140696 RepID=UPI001DB96B2C|nr:hypothetical protein [Anaerolineae bacterium]MBK7202381.1 hypothetical protein [Anaerolineae bacterium]
MDQQLVHFIQSNPKIMMGKFQPQAHCAWPDDNPFQRVFHISLRFQPQALRRVARRQPVSTGFSYQPAVSTAGWRRPGVHNGAGDGSLAFRRNDPCAADPLNMT